jgi:hypothetical protein
MIVTICRHSKQQASALLGTATGTLWECKAFAPPLSFPWLDELAHDASSQGSFPLHAEVRDATRPVSVV